MVSYYALSLTFCMYMIAYSHAADTHLDYFQHASAPL